MRSIRTLLPCLVVAWIASTVMHSQPRGPSTATLYEGARLIVGDGRSPIESGAFVVQNGRIARVGKRGTVTAPAGAARVDLRGKTVMPAWINVHVHIG